MVADGVRRRAGSGSSIRDLSESPERDDVQSAKLHAQKTEILARLKMDDRFVWPALRKRRPGGVLLESSATVLSFPFSTARFSSCGRASILWTAR